MGESLKSSNPPRNRSEGLGENCDRQANGQQRRGGDHQVGAVAKSSWAGDGAIALETDIARLNAKKPQTMKAHQSNSFLLPPARSRLANGQHQHLERNERRKGLATGMDKPRTLRKDESRNDKDSKRHSQDNSNSSCVSFGSPAGSGSGNNPSTFKLQPMPSVAGSQKIKVNPQNLDAKAHKRQRLKKYGLHK